MLHLFRSRVSPALVTLLEHIGGSAHKRVDENRELRELLRSKAPHLLDERPWTWGGSWPTVRFLWRWPRWQQICGLPPGLPSGEVFHVHGPNDVHPQIMAFRCVAPPGFAGFAPCLLSSHGHPAPIPNAASRLRRCALRLPPRDRRKAHPRRATCHTPFFTDLMSRRLI